MGFKFGPQYKKFLKEKGVDTFDGDEVYGLKDKGAGHLSTITATMDLRKSGDDKNVPDDMAVIHAVGNGDFHLIDGKDNVHLWFHEKGTVVSKKMKFDEFVKQL